MTKNIAVFDVETGGFNWTDGLAQIAIAVVETETWKIVETYMSYIWESHRDYGDGAFRVNQIDPAWLKSHGKSWGEVVLEVDDMLGENGPNLICAYNAEFDCGFMNERGVAIPRAIDPLKIARKFYKNYDNKLRVLTARLKGEGFKFKEHDARGDVRATAACLEVLSRDDSYGPKALIAATVDYDGYTKKQRSRRNR